MDLPEKALLVKTKKSGNRGKVFLEIIRCGIRGTFHRGYPKMPEYCSFVAGLKGTSGTKSVIPNLKRIKYSSTFPPFQTDLANYYFSDVQDKTVIKCCDEVLKEIERIILEQNRPSLSNCSTSVGAQNEDRIWREQTSSY